MWWAGCWCKCQSTFTSIWKADTGIIPWLVSSGQKWLSVIQWRHNSVWKDGQKRNLLLEWFLFILQHKQTVTKDSSCGEIIFFLTQQSRPTNNLSEAYQTFVPMKTLLMNQHLCEDSGKIMYYFPSLLFSRLFPRTYDCTRFLFRMAQDDSFSSQISNMTLYALCHPFTTHMSADTGIFSNRTAFISD